MFKRLNILVAMAVIALTRELDIADSFTVSCASSELSAEIGNDAEGATFCSVSSTNSSSGSSNSSSPSSSRNPRNIQPPGPPPFQPQDYRDIPRR